MATLLQPELPGLNQSPLSIRIGLMPKGQSLSRCVDCRAHIFTDPLAAHRPSFVQERDLAEGIHFSHHVKATAGDRQPSRWDQSLQIRRQAYHRDSPSNLSGGAAVQRGRLINRVIPVLEVRRFFIHLRPIGKVKPRPEAPHPQAMKGLDLIVAFRFIDRCKKRLDAAEQTQAHDLTDHARMRMTSAKRAFIIELQNLRQTQFGPRFPQVNASRRAGLVGVARQMHRLTEEIDRVKILNLFAAMHMSVMISIA